jgi:hypothetical protein
MQMVPDIRVEQAEEQVAAGDGMVPLIVQA